MLTVRYAEERGFSQFSWLKSWHTFSFGRYYDANWMGFASLRVINDDEIAPGSGFDTHPHRDMEIVSYVLRGALAHKDSMGNGSVIQAGDVQRMSAGSGVTHSEYNDSATEPVHLLQIWFLPQEQGIEPSYEQKTFSREGKIGCLQLVVSPTGRDGSLSLNQDVCMYVGVLEHPEQFFSYSVERSRVAWIHVARGTLTLNGMSLKGGDAVVVDAPERLEFSNGVEAEVIVFEMASLKLD